ncbi:hypothetical protein ACH40E_39415 [Streptomyces acidicola]|uniref:hypothetical protein n=1 Tax=Streptomyces acidicola TaxID=2596892 RepID=UPI0037A3C40E
MQMTREETKWHGDEDTKGGWYVLAHGDEYFTSRHSRIEFVSFEYRISSLAWLRGRITKSVDVELAELRAHRKSGAHRVPGWEGESDLMLDESETVLDTDVRQISAGVIVVAAIAALESLMNQMLNQPNDERVHKAGFTQKARELAARWSAVIDRTELDEHISWLRERRNSFAHRLIDDVDRQWRTSTPPWNFDDEMAGETLARASAVAWILEAGWEHYLGAQGRFTGI